MLSHISVSADFQRNGFGHELMKNLFEEGRKRGISRVDLEVWDFNQGAQKFFSNYGFESLSMRKTLNIEKESNQSCHTTPASAPR
ncbi:acetyltransferase, GNAT family [Verrucomicrobiia bacterium DG1235]|nr:acetyltransferase, GNAT family [Verrucomicrobiae bacterium DG1235]